LDCDSGSGNDVTLVHWSHLLPFSNAFGFTGVYDVIFECKNGDVFALRIDCQAAPIVKLYGCQAQHPLLDADMHVRIGYRDDYLLGAAVMETILQMQLDPPMILCFTDADLKAIQPRRAHALDSNGIPQVQSRSHSYQVELKDQMLQTVVEVGDNNTLDAFESSSIILVHAEPVKDGIDTVASPRCDPSGLYIPSDSSSSTETLNAQSEKDTAV
jgi:hypothetical protein